MIKNILKKIIFTIMVMCLSLVFVVNATENDDLYGSKKLEDFDNATFGCTLGSIEDQVVKKYFPDAKIKYYKETPDILTSLITGKVDGMVREFSVFMQVHRNYPDMKIVEEAVAQLNQGILLSESICKNDGGIVKKELNEFIKDSKENGFIDYLKDKWIMQDANNIEYENKVLNNSKKTLNVAMILAAPAVFVKKDGYAGLEVEFIETFCEKYGYNIKYEISDFSSIIVGINTGKYDMGLGSISITEERKKNVSFSDSYYTEDMFVLYYEKNDNKMSIFEKLINNFKGSFIKEDRYKLVIQGMINTILITVFSVLVGIVVGFLLYMIYNKGVAIMIKLVDLYVYIINGLPFLVLLLALYYIIFAKVDIPGVIISIIAFSIMFSIFIFSSLVNNVKTLDAGQTEAAYALGYNKEKTFEKILLPQIIINIYPSFKDQIIFLLKETSIVGYIAVVDLTRAGDVIRSRTYNALFPIISIAIIYFVLGIVFKAILKNIEKHINPYNRKRTDILKGIKK